MADEEKEKEKVDKVENYLLAEARGEKDKTDRKASEKNLPIADVLWYDSNAKLPEG